MSSRIPPVSLPPRAIVHRDLAYVTHGHARHTLDLYLPGVGPAQPLIVWVHGGAFRVGSKEDGFLWSTLRTDMRWHPSTTA